jgi:hypothetical protein
LVLLFDAADEPRVREFGASSDLRRVAEKAGVEVDTFSIKVIPD